MLPERRSGEPRRAQRSVSARALLRAALLGLSVFVSFAPTLCILDCTRRLPDGRCVPVRCQNLVGMRFDGRPNSWLLAAACVLLTLAAWRLFVDRARRKTRTGPL
ncbi:MAG: hypothetical protein ABR575_11505 [Actinomycetota bacterium]